MELIRAAASGISNLLVAADLWPVLVLGCAFGLLLVQSAILTVFVSSLSQRLSRVSRHLRELSKVIQQQTQVIERFRKVPKDDLTSALPVSKPEEGAGEQLLLILQSGDGPVKSQEQLKTLREVLLAEPSKKD